MLLVVMSPVRLTGEAKAAPVPRVPPEISVRAPFTGLTDKTWVPDSSRWFR